METGREVFLLDSVQRGLGLALRSDTDKRGRGVTDHPPPSHQCLPPAGPSAGGLSAQNCFPAAELPVWGEDKATDHYKIGEKCSGGRHLRNSVGPRGLPGGGVICAKG